MSALVTQLAWHVVDDDGNVVGATLYPEDAAALVAVCGVGVVWRGDGRSVWSNAVDGDPLDVGSYDDIGAVMRRRSRQVICAHATRAGWVCSLRPGHAGPHGNEQTDPLDVPPTGDDA